MANIFNQINASTPNSVARPIANEVVAGKNAIAASLVTLGQPVTIEDTFQTMADKMKLIVRNVDVTPIAGNPTDWHDLAQVVAQNGGLLTDYPYYFAILLNKFPKSINLSGSNFYLTSDGYASTESRMHTFDIAKDEVGADAYADFTGKVAGLATDITITADNVGAVGNIKLANGASTITELITEWNVAHPTNTITLTSGDGTQVPLVRFFGTVAGITTSVDIKQDAGTTWVETITLVADGVKSVATLVSDWNTANPTQTLTVASGVTTQIPTDDIVLTQDEIQLGGGFIGNAGKSTRWVIFANSINNTSPIYDFGATVNAQSITMGVHLLQCFIGGINPVNLNFYSASAANTCPLRGGLFFADRTGLDSSIEFTLKQNALQGCTFTRLKFPNAPVTNWRSGTAPSTIMLPNLVNVSFSEGTEEIFATLNLLGATVSAATSLVSSFRVPNSCKRLFISSGATAFYGSKIQELRFPTGMTDIWIGATPLGAGSSNMRMFDSSIFLQRVIIPQVENLCLSNSTTGVAMNTLYKLFQNCTALEYLEIGTPTKFFAQNSGFEGCTALTNIVIGSNWRYGLAITTSATDCPLTVASMNAMFANLKNLTPYLIGTVSTTNNTTLITGDGTQDFREVLSVGETMIVNSIGRIVASVTQNTVTLTTTVSGTASGLSWSAPKTITLGATNLAKMSAGELEVATDKGFTLA
jgi:hypothetical protein